MPLVARSDGANIYFDLHGTTGEAVLLIQGVGLIGNGWRPQIEGLSASHRLLTFDNRGIGRSTAADGGSGLSIEQMADDAAAVVEAAGWDSCHVVGHSMGGVIAQRLALMRPAVVRSLSLLCTVARGRDATRMTLSMVWTGVRMTVGTRRSRRRAFLGLVYPKEMLAAADAEVLARELEPLFGHDLSQQPAIAMKQLRALGAHDCTAELGRLAAVPTMVVSAEHDRVTRAEHGRALAAAIPGATYDEIAGAAHGVPIHDAGRINELIARHIRAATG